MDSKTSSSLATEAPSLVELKNKIPQLQIWTPSCKELAEHRTTFIRSNAGKPLAIVLPQNEDEVAAVVAYANDASIPLAVRSGGHDTLGRSMPKDALVLGHARL
jgi:FAD/FMN-containing dehydrogenase